MVDSSQSPQNLYAKHLRQLFGYPLRCPEPKPGLPPSYTDNGLQIGDVGYVDDEGMFEVLFNICFPADHDLHRDRLGRRPQLEVGLIEFEPNRVTSLPKAFPPGRVICHGIQSPPCNDLKQAQRFTSYATSGAALVLPSGALHQYLNESQEKEFCDVAEKWALNWCRFAGRRSLYLITGFYKTSSWYLASFHSVKPTGQVLLERDSTGRYSWHSGCDHRYSEEDQNENQTVLLSGFKIEVRDWDEHPVIEKLPMRPRGLWSRLWSFLLTLISFWQWLINVRAHIKRVPASYPPFHPSDIINRYLLDKNPNVKVAITHDSQWIDILEMNELSHEEMWDEGCFKAFLEEKYVGSPNSDNVVHLRRKADRFDNSNFLRKSMLSPKTFSIPSIPHGTLQFFITRMRVENVATCLQRMPIGFYVHTQFESTNRRTKCKPISLWENVIEWDDEIILPADSTVQVWFSIIASFEFEPMLGSGETILILKTSMDALGKGSGTNILFSPGEGDGSSCPSLLVTLEERQFDTVGVWAHSNNKSKYEDRSCIEAETTDRGQSALLHYQRGGGIERLKECIECFGRVLDLCPPYPYHDCHAAALSNHASANFMDYRIHGKISNLDVTITSYRKALKLRPGHHPDRARTLLYLTQALLYWQWSQCEPSVADEIEGLAKEIRQICSENSYDYRAACLVVQTLKRYRVLSSGKIAEIGELVVELGVSARMPPDWHFDRPYRLINFSTALRKRFEITGNTRDLDESISVMQEAVRLTKDGHFDKPWIMAALGDALCVRFVQCGRAIDISDSITMLEGAMKLVLNDHVDKPWMLVSLGSALRVRFSDSGEVTDRNRSISMIKEALMLAPDGHIKKPWMLASPGDTLHVRFQIV